MNIKEKKDNKYHAFSSLFQLHIALFHSSIIYILFFLFKKSPDN